MICMWWDDVQQLRFPMLRNGANRPSLIEAQCNFRTFGASDLRLRFYIREPRPHDRRDPQWRPFDPAIDIVPPAVEPAGKDHAFPADPITLYYWQKSVEEKQV
jgi:hypothetical protein